MLEDFKDGKIFTGVIAGYILCLAVLFIGEYVYGGRNTDGAISNIKEQQHGVSVEIGNARDSVKQSQDSLNGVSNTISRVQGRLEASERIADSNAREIERLAKIVSECRSIAEENRVILNGVREASCNAKK